MSYRDSEDCFVGILLSGCIGDILGSTNEGKTFKIIRDEGIVRDFKNNKYTDDTELTIVLAQYLLKYYSGISHLVSDKVHTMYRDTVSKSSRGYSERTKTILSNYHSFMPGGSADTNGCVMRIAPIAFVHFKSKLADIELKKLIKSVIFCTHGENVDSVDVSFLHVKILTTILNNANCSNALELYNYIIFIAKKMDNTTLFPLLLLINPYNKMVLFGNKYGIPTLKDNITKTIFGKDLFQIKAIHCYICVLICFLYNFDYPIDALIMATNIGGDTDTIAKIVGDLVGAKYGTSWIPLPWSQPEQCEEIVNLGKSLHSKYKKIL